MVLYASGRLEGLASDWWDAYTAAHPAPNTITWQQFRDAFRAHHIPDGVLKLKQRVFLALKQGNMSVNEYLDKFTKLSRYAPDEVNTDPKRQECFLDSLIGPLNYQLQSHTFPNFAILLNKAIGLENKRKELSEKKRKFQYQGQSSSNSRPRYSFPQNPQFHSDRVENILKTCSCSARSSSLNASTHKTPCTPNFQQNRPAHTSGAPVRNTTPVQPNGCFKCGELGYYANNCPKCGMQTPQRSNVQKAGQPSSQARPGNSSTPGNKAEVASGVVLGTFPNNSVPAIVLFDS
jgi:hypothetical protein